MFHAFLAAVCFFAGGVLVGMVLFDRKPDTPGTLFLIVADAALGMIQLSYLI